MKKFIIHPNIYLYVIFRMKIMEYIDIYTKGNYIYSLIDDKINYNYQDFKEINFNILKNI